MGKLSERADCYSIECLSPLSRCVGKQSKKKKLIVTLFDVCGHSDDVGKLSERAD